MDSHQPQTIRYLSGNQTAVSGSPPYVSASLTHNLILRVTLALAANAVCLVPLRVLRRNGEFAAAVFIISVELLNFEAVLCSLIWRDDDFSSWWSGHGLCDIVIHIHNAVTALFTSCLLAIMRNLFQQVGLMRAGPLQRSERRRRNLVQALIIFPLPIINLTLTAIVAERRYEVGTLIGCSWAPHSSWPNLVFFVFPPVVLSVITVVYAALTYHRFRHIAKMTETALSNNLRASRRSQRTKRRLYLMVMAIMLPYLPLVVAVAVANVLQKSGGEHFDFNAVHYHADPPWHVVLFYQSSEILWINLNNCYINVLVAIPIFWFFGTTKDAINEYRLAALSVGFGRLFPILRREYDPDRAPCSGTSTGSSHLPVTVAVDSHSPSPFAKISSSLSSRRLILFRSASPARGPPDPERGSELVAPVSCAQEEDVATSLSRARHDVSVTDPARHRNPFLFRTRLNFRLPSRPSPEARLAPDLALRPLPPAASFPAWEVAAAAAADVEEMKT
ncbi:hypothetical protein XA68_10659 [Ophiocordyceps unilateralis]|uniref:G-protein coupled receptors family 1 profile domain-containing protein n=1 Tax=Ophiocordyceps unilateralis TaxID=268505 RepID=A0A2A9PI91_OPHUN|nr:hypothetical protein XA68_10659 [Ophiocordyceps unilateralis]